MRVKGKIISWNDDKGFGFIKPPTGNRQVFIHINAFHNRARRPEINQFVSYSLSTDKQGRPCAIDATLAGDRLPSKTKQANDTFLILLTAVFLSFVCTAVISSKLPALILALYIAASLLTFFVYAIDKSAARKGNWRTSESTLHLLSLIGGWPGAVLAQKILRHKTKKKSFRLAFKFTILLNCGTFSWLFTENGEAVLKTLIVNLV